MAAKTLALLFLLSFASSLACAGDAATLAITVRHISDAGGELRLGVYDQTNYAMKGGIAVARKSANARGSTMTFIFDNIPPGTYAAKVLQDVNRNGNFDFGPKGMEPFGFSNDPKVTVGLPPFDDAKFTVTAGANSIEIALH
jgi:uncharacterized protein (DUF2141 family)